MPRCLWIGLVASAILSVCQCSPVRAAYAYNPAIIKQTYERLSAPYDPSMSRGDYKRMVASLDNVDVEALLWDYEGLTPFLRVRILNDYGFWLWKANDTVNAVRVLKAVVRLAPLRAVAWLNLGDAQATLLRPTGPWDPPQTWEDKLALTREAITSYQHYLVLTKSPVQHVNDFLAFNLLNFREGEDACKFVTSLANAHRLLDLGIAGIGPFDLLHDGNKYYVYIGDGSSPRIGAFTAPEADGDQAWQDLYSGNINEQSAVDFWPLDDEKGVDGADGVSPGDELRLVTLGDAYYALQITPSTANDAVYVASGFGGDATASPFAEAWLVQPNNGYICHIAGHVKSSLYTGQGNPLCAQFLAGASFPRPDIKRLPPASEMRFPGYFENRSPDRRWYDYDLTGWSTIDLGNDGHARDLAYYDIDPIQLPDCKQTGLLPYDSKNKSVLVEPFSQTIRNIPLGCDGAQEFPIIYKGKTYIETTHGPKLPTGEAAGAGIYEVRDDKVRPVCLIQNDFTYYAK